MADASYTVEQALPHARPMILLDELIDWSAERLTAGVVIHPAQPFFGCDGVPTHVAVEYMAQACGAYAGIEALKSGRMPRVGLFLGTRNFAATQPWFRDGDQLRVTATVVYREDDMGVFDCLVAEATVNNILASARLTVYQPPDGSTIGGFDG
jgi:predicted hotdog family 3-hydroxylacyl-ACP dehydratase